MIEYSTRSMNDERWYTPRAQASTGRSSVHSYGTARSENIASTSSDSEFYTPRWESNHQACIPPRHPQRFSRIDSGDVESRGPNAISSDEGSIFSFTRHGRIEEVDNLLLKGRPVDGRDNFGNTILHIACQNGNNKLMKLALRYGANMNIANFKGNTALHFAYRYGYANTLGDYLQRKGADSTIRNLGGEICTDLGGTGY